MAFKYSSGLPISGPQAQIWTSGTNWKWGNNKPEPLASSSDGGSSDASTYQIIGAARNISVQNQYSRSPVIGIGSFFVNEAPPLVYSGQCTMEAYLLCASKGIMNSFSSEYSDPYDFFLFLLYNAGIDITMAVDRLKRGSTGFTKSDFAQVTFASIRSALITEDSFTVSESELAGRNGNFMIPRPPQWIGDGSGSDSGLQGDDGISKYLNATFNVDEPSAPPSKLETTT